MVYNPVKNQAVSIINLATRADVTQAITVPHSFSGDLVHCYIAFTDKDAFDVSDSRYAGAITVV